MAKQSLKSIKNTLDNVKYVCLFGVGALLNECYDQIVSFLGKEPDFVCDNAAGKWESAFRGKKCISPDELCKLGNETAVIITVRKYEGIYKQLRDMGVKDIFLSCFDSGYYFVNDIQRLEGDTFDGDNDKSSRTYVHLEGKWTLITGASRGIGRQIAIAMAKLGSNVVLHSRSVSHVEEVAGICSSYGVQSVPIAAEFGNLAEVNDMLSRLDRMVPQIDIVFNNAAVHRGGPWPSGIWITDSDLYRDCFMVNSVTPALICHKLIPPMIQRGFGRLVNIHTNLHNVPHEIAYICSKAALDKFVYEMALRLHGAGVMMTLSDPGWVKTDAGGAKAPNPVESVIPGILLGALLDEDVNGCRFSAQDYVGLSIEDAIRRAKLRLRQQRCKWV